MAFKTDKIGINKDVPLSSYYLDVSGNLNVDGSIFQRGVEFVGGGGGGTGDVAWANGNVGSDNYLITATGDGSIVAESGVTYNGTTLSTSGNISATGEISVDTFFKSNDNSLVLQTTGDGTIRIRPAGDGTNESLFTSSLANIGTNMLVNGDASVTGNIMAQGQVYSDTFFRSSDSEVVLAVDSAGTIYLRPTTPSNPAAQSTFTTTLAAIGTDMTVDGSITASEGFKTGNFEVVHNSTSDSLDFNYIA